MTASLVADERVNLVDDDRRDRPENLPAALARQEEIERLRRRHEDVRRPARHRRALSRERVARAGRGRDERVAPLPDRRPALALRRRGLAEPVLKPRLNGGVKGGEERHRDAILTIRGRTTRPERRAWRRARIEKETEGMTLVSTRHGNRQFPFAPLHPRAPAIE